MGRVFLFMCGIEGEGLIFAIRCDMFVWYMVCEREGMRVYMCGVCALGGGGGEGEEGEVGCCVICVCLGVVSVCSVCVSLFVCRREGAKPRTGSCIV